MPEATTRKRPNKTNLFSNNSEQLGKQLKTIFERKTNKDKFVFFGLQSVSGDGCPIHGAPVAGHVGLQTGTRNPGAIEGPKGNLFRVVFQFVSSCFPVSRSVGAGIGQIGVCFSGIAGPRLSDSGAGGRVERMEGTNGETRGWLMVG
ncbi:MAG: hypothetical protein IKQ55_10575 [Kiritimatiellae bacterium]|nr:hypothetical protein [Kiritimatiellia bacterium]